MKYTKKRLKSYRIELGVLLLRITNNMVVANTVWNVNKNAERLAKAQERMSTQSQIQLPSDDPIIATRAIKYRNYVANVEQYQKNVDDALSWQEVTESALGDLNDVIQQTRELTVQAQGVLTTEDKEKIKSQITELREQAVQIMNTTYAGRYVFGGFTTDQTPYEIKSTAVGDKVLFKGQYVSLGGPMSSSINDTDIINYCTANAGTMYQDTANQSINYNIGAGAMMAVNVEGQDVVGNGLGSNLFDTFDKLLLGLDGATTYKTANITTSPASVTINSNTIDLSQILDDWDTDFSRVSTARSDLGARMKYVTLTKNRLSNDEITYTKLMSNNEDIDVAEASMDVSTAKYVYEASLSVGASVMSKSLLDFLK